jgi:small subunit ribosomal protein S6
LNQYDIAVLFDPQLSVDEEKATGKVDKIFKDNDVKVVKTDKWGKKKLSYKIGQHTEALYIFYTVEVPAANVAKVESTFNITDEIIRFLIVKIDAKKEAKITALKEEKKAKAAKSAPADVKES